MSKFIQREKDLLLMFTSILNNKKIYLNDLARDEETNIVNNMKSKYYEEIFSDVLKYCSLIGLHCSYEYDELMHCHNNFNLDFSDVKFNFQDMLEDYKKCFGILNIYMMLRSDVALNKKMMEEIYGFKLTSAKLLRIKNEIEYFTKRKIITRRDLSYCFERVI